MSRTRRAKTLSFSPRCGMCCRATEFRELAERFEDEEHQRFGQAGFQGVVERVADIEKSLDIYDLSQFTPT